MAQRTNAHELIPSAKRLTKSLRDLGYDFSAAIADIVDNSIEAGATSIEIDVEFDGDDSWVRIADNGKGMEPAELREAMRYGAEREYNDEDLGKFGLGLKTASLSQCQRLSVASRTSRGRANIAAYCWDMAHIEKTNRWEILPLERTGLGPAIYYPLKKSTGTVVLWQKLDRILGFKHPYGEFARKKLVSMCRDAEEHLAMVFHRFLSGEVRGRRLKILLNGNGIEPWDPYSRNEPKTKVLTPAILKLEHEGVSGSITLEPFVLPSQKNYSSPDAFRRASGPAKWNQQQGFYIYRAGRMIQSGGWCRLRASDEHTKLARVALSFSPILDEAFKINVAKMQVQLPTNIRDDFERAIDPVIRIARKTYDKGAPVQALSAPVAMPSPPVPYNQATSTSLPAVLSPSPAYGNSQAQATENRWTLSQFCSKIEEISEHDEKPIIMQSAETPEELLDRTRRSKVTFLQALGLVRLMIADGIPREQALSNPAVPPEFKERILDTLIQEDNITLEPARVLVAAQRRDEWLRQTDRSDWYYWPILREYLLGIRGWAARDVQSLDEVTDRILGQLASPPTEQFDIRGLVLGYVQSGKTANFTALVAKAADVGYRLIVVLSGIDNGLRRQTQIRLIRELVGYADGRTNAVRLPPLGRQWHAFTSEELNGDFQPGHANHAALQGTQPVLLVVKKNGSVLRRLLHWLDEAPPSCSALLLMVAPRNPLPAVHPSPPHGNSQ